MDTFLFVGGFLVLMFSPAAPMCLPTDYTLYVEKPECSFCVAINTTICMGFCYSRVSAQFYSILGLETVHTNISRGMTVF